MGREYPIYQKDETGHDEDDRYYLSRDEKVERWKNPLPVGDLQMKRERERVRSSI